MPPRTNQEPILANSSALLWQRLAPEHWPLPLNAWPAGTALVGGAVRDGLLNRLGTTPDLDLVVPCDGIALAKGWAKRHGGTCVVLDPERQIARLVIQGWTIDVARQEGGSLEADLGRRDFTINAIALPLSQGDGSTADGGMAAALVDPTGGLRHLEQGQVVAVQEANLRDDPLRLLRGVRLATELNFELEAQSREWIGRLAPLLGDVAGERVLAELEKLAAAPLGHRGLLDCLQLGLLKPWAAEPRGQATLGGLDGTSATARGLTPEEQAWALPLARLVCLLDQPGLMALRSSKRLQQRIQTLRLWLARTSWSQEPAGPKGHKHNALTEEEQLRFHQDLEADLPAMALFLPEEDAQRALAQWRNPNDPLGHPRPPIDGEALQKELGLAPGKQLGALLRHLTLERAFGRLPEPLELNTILETARSWLEEPQNRRRD